MNQNPSHSQNNSTKAHQQADATKQSFNKQHYAEKPETFAKDKKAGAAADRSEETTISSSEGESFTDRLHLDERITDLRESLQVALKKLGDFVEHTGVAAEKRGLKRVGETMEMIGDKIEHAMDAVKEQKSAPSSKVAKH